MINTFQSAFGTEFPNILLMVADDLGNTKGSYKGVGSTLIT